MRMHKNIFIGTFFALAFLAWAEPVSAVDPDLIDVIEVIGTNPFITHTNILPGDVFMDKMTVRNLTGTPQNIVMSLHIDLSQGLVPNPPFELEEQIDVTIERVGSGLITLPGGGTHQTLQDLSDTLIDLGSLPALGTQEYKITFIFNPNAGNEYQNTKVYFNVAISIDVPEVHASLRIEKTNDSVGDEAPGNEVQYTLRVTALDDDVNDVVLTDLPPKGFEYVPLSGSGAPFIHAYASPGIWDLGDMAAGETKTVTYRTRISDTQDDGLYRDLAFARGVSQGSGSILAVDPIDSDNFVGTQVAVAVDATPTVIVPADHENKLIEKTKKKIQYVLGASTLPFTGANGVWLALALVLFVTGIGLAFFGRRLKKENESSNNSVLMKTLLFTLFSGTLLFMGQGASAASLAVQIEKPEAVVNTPNFKIGFVTLDILGRSLTVECYKDSDIIPFATYSLDSTYGGNSGDCQVDATVIPAAGDYTFYVKAVTTSGDSETATSVTVPVKLVATPPGTPYNYDRHDASCQNVITFTTANDVGKTVKVELYRSSATTFTADASTKLDEQVIGSDVVGSFTEAAPGCSNDSFYALRAVDAYGFGSDFVGDKDVHVNTHTVTHTKTKTIETGGAAPTGAIAVSGPAAEGAVEGAETTNGEGQGAVTNESAEGAVLGEATAVEVVGNWLQQHPWLSGLMALAVLVIAYFMYRKRHNGKSKQ